MNNEELLNKMASECSTWDEAGSMLVHFQCVTENGFTVYDRVSRPDWLIAREKFLLNKYHHDYWGQTGDEVFHHDDPGYLIGCMLEIAIDDNDEYNDEKDVSCVFEISGGDVSYIHISGIMSHISDAEDYLGNCAYGDETVRETREYSREQFIDSIEECFEEWINEGNDEGCEKFSLSKKLSHTVGRIYYRSVKEFQKASVADDDDRMKVVANTFRRRFQRAVKHSHKEKCYCLWNGKDYDVTITEGIVTDIKQTNEY